MLAALVMPQAAFKNLRRLDREGALARFGYYESIDYTPERLPQNQKRARLAAVSAMRVRTADAVPGSPSARRPGREGT